MRMHASRKAISRAQENSHKHMTLQDLQKTQCISANYIVFSSPAYSSPETQDWPEGQRSPVGTPLDLRLQMVSVGSIYRVQAAQVFLPVSSM